MTWDDLFKQYKNRHRNLVDKLEFNNTIREELMLKVISVYHKLSALFALSIS